MGCNCGGGKSFSSAATPSPRPSGTATSNRATTPPYARAANPNTDIEPPASQPRPKRRTI